MGIRAGDIRQAKFYGKELDPAPDIDLTIQLTGISLTNESNGNGTVHSKGKRRLAGFTGGKWSCDPSRKDVEFFQDKATAGVAGPFQLTLITGQTYIGSLIPEGDINYSTGDGTFELSAMGQKLVQV